MPTGRLYNRTILSRITQSVFKVMTAVEEFILSGGILVIAFLTIANVFCRTFLGFSLAFAEELSQFLIVLITFVGLSYGAAQGRHIRMTAIYDELPKGAKKALTIFISFTTAFLLGYLAWFAFSYSRTVSTLGTVSPVLQIPLGWVYLSAPFGLALGAIQYFLAGVKNLSADEIYLAYDVPLKSGEPVVDGI